MQLLKYCQFGEHEQCAGTVGYVTCGCVCHQPTEEPPLDPLAIWALEDPLEALLSREVKGEVTEDRP